MALTVQDILTDARAILIDPVAVRWTDAELILWLNDAMRQCVLIKPDCNPITEEFVCVAGYKQSFSTLALDLVLLLDVVANTSTGGGTETAVTFIKRNVLDTEDPTWRSVTETTEIQHYMYNTRQRDIFYVYPPATVGSTLELVYAAVPTAVTVVGDTVPLQDIYGPSLVNYVVWRAFSKDSDFAGNMQLAGGYYSAFVQGLTGKLAAENTEAPDRNIPPAIVQAVD